jgi:putative ABC transport system permease protein
MAKRPLSWARAGTIAVRDLKSSPGKFFFVVLSVAVGVAALVGIRGFSMSFRQTLQTEARSLLAGDLSARVFRAPTDDEKKKIAELDASGVKSTWVTETLAMSNAPDGNQPMLVALKAVDTAQYPFYGAAELEPAMPLGDALRGDSVVVADEYLVRTNAKVGDSILFGGQAFRIAAVLKQEPDRISSGASLGPRVMMSAESIAKAQLIGYGSRASRRLLIKLPAKSDPIAMRKQIETMLPDAQVMDYKEGNPGLTEGLDHATALLSLICLVAMVLGAIGVAMAMHAHLEQRMDILAILKSLGATSADLLRIYLLQTVGLGLAGGVIGAGAGLGFMYLLPFVFGKLIPIHLTISFPGTALLTGLATGVLTTLLFCLPPLLDVRNVRPVLVLRRLVDAPTENFFVRWLKRWPQLLLSGVMLVALGLIARALSDSNVVAIGFLVALVSALVVLLLLAAVTLFVLRVLLARVRLHLPSSVRQGLANLYRPGNQSAPVLAALGTGELLILSVFLFQSGVLRDLHETASPSLPNIFLLDIGNDELAGVQKFFKEQQGVDKPLEMLPIVQGKVRQLNGQPIEQIKIEHFPMRMLLNAEFTWSDTIPAGDKLTAGQWWSSPSEHSIAVSAGTAERLHIGVGSTMVIETGGVAHTLRVAALVKPDGQHLGARTPFIVPTGELAGERAIWYGGVRIDPQRVSAMEREFFKQYPTITVINLADVIVRIESIVDQITFVIHFLAGFSIFAGLMILASSISGTRFKRMRESVILKTLGAKRMHIVRVFTVEFVVLGILAGAVGTVFANLLTWYLLHRVEIPYHVSWMASTVSVVSIAVLAVATGWITSYRLLGLRPLEILREE